MKAGETTLRELIQGEKQFVIPLYQRTYAWGPSQLGTLWSDILDQSDALARGQATTHFLGSVVLAPSPHLDALTSQWIVVDGQQRLTTLLLALCALRDHLAAEDPSCVERINEQHLINKFRQGDLRYRLLPTQADRAALMACIDGQLDERVSGNIGAAYEFFRAALVDADDPADPHDIERIEKVILSRLSLVHIVVEKDDNAFRIFESLNNTGTRLSPVDLIRNYVFMCLPTRGEHVYRLYWLPLQERLRKEHGTQALELLMYLVLVLKRGEDAKYSDVYRGHQELLDETAGHEAKVERYAAELARRAEHLKLILSPEQEEDVRIRARLTFLNEWQAQTTYPPIMRMLELREEGHAHDDEVADALAYIESFLVRRLIGGVPTRNLNRIFQRLTVQLSADEPLAETVRSALSPARLYWLSDDELRTAIRTRQFYWQGRAGQKKLVLRRLEETFEGGEPVLLEDKKITIEHVLPQHLTDEWRAELSENGDEAAMVHRELVHTLGNLTLTAYNSELGDMPYKRKRERLRQTGIAMTQAIVGRPRWNKAEILGRADDLASRAINIWPSPAEREDGDAPGRDWTLLHKALANLPTGSWTTYAELAELIGSAPLPVGVHLAGRRVLNAHRVITTEGRPSKNFRWVDENDDRDINEVLRQEGIHFDESGRADPNQRVTATELAQLLGLPGAEDMRTADAEDVDPSELAEHELRFHRQIGERQGPDVARAVSGLLDHWRRLGEGPSFGRAATARCRLLMRHGGQDYWMLAIYPAYVEIPFEPLARRVPFDDGEARDELRRRLNTAPGVELPAAKLSLYPNFPISLLTDDSVWDVVVATLDWFVDQVRESD
ncbi:DUF262 domain-containing protein [Actinomadura rugatobispora]|uniref:DUF262 domain-containing protein n=1 Tax=Actinomadura rugatobispora TaxID=1994 RepID=A0ABW0ZYG4_9ACTN|nr:DUF262 domain-containing protein [Actinomadura rugatobispora]